MDWKKLAKKILPSWLLPASFFQNDSAPKIGSAAPAVPVSKPEPEPEEVKQVLRIRAIEKFLERLMTVTGRNNFGAGTVYTYMEENHKLPGSNNIRPYLIVDTEEAHIYNGNRSCSLLHCLREELKQLAIASGISGAGIDQSIAVYRGGTALGRHDRLYIEDNQQLGAVVSNAITKDGAKTAQAVKTRFDEIVKQSLAAAPQSQR